MLGSPPVCIMIVMIEDRAQKIRMSALVFAALNQLYL